jgi:hypothetical protein
MQKFLKMFSDLPKKNWYLRAHLKTAHTNNKVKYRQPGQNLTYIDIYIDNSAPAFIDRGGSST